MGQWIALADFADQQRAARVARKRLGVPGQGGNEDDRRAVEIGGERHAAGAGVAGLAKHYTERGMAGGGDQAAGEADRFRVGFADDVGGFRHDRPSCLIRLLIGASPA